MESGLTMLHCLLQHTLRSLCSSSDSSKWVYAVFWRIIPRNFPPPKWDFGGTALDRSKGNKRNWILVWEDGFCDLQECEHKGNGVLQGKFGADVFFKMSHEVYSYGEGLVGKVAAENSHKWIFKDNNPIERDSSFISAWNMSMDPPPKAWELQFSSGIQTIAIISVGEGIVQLGSFDKIFEDLNFVITTQRKFSYLQTIPGVFAIQRPHLPDQHPYILKPNLQMIDNPEHENPFSVYHLHQTTGVKRMFSGRSNLFPFASSNLGWNSKQNCITEKYLFSMPGVMPNISCSFGALLSKLPSTLPSYNAGIEAPETAFTIHPNSTIHRVKDEVWRCQEANDEDDKSLNRRIALQSSEVVKLGFGPLNREGKHDNLNRLE